MTDKYRNTDSSRLPKQLRNRFLRFITCNRDKSPKFSLYHNTLKYIDIDHSENYGVICGYNNLRVIDIDDKVKYNNNPKDFDTFVVETARGYHVYFYCDYYETNHAGEIGEVRCKNQYVIAPGSIHPSGFIYSVLHDKPIKKIGYEAFKDIIKPFLVTKKHDNNNTNTFDDSRSGREFGLCIEHIKRGIKFRSLKDLDLKDYVYSRMDEYDRWNKAPNSYKKRTYENALKRALKEVC